MNMYEHPWLGLIIAALFLLIFLWSAEFNIRKIKLWQLLLVLIIALAALAIDYFVQTDNEKVRGLVVKIVRGAQDEDVNAIGECIAPDYHDSFNKTRMAFMDNARMRFSTPLIEKNVLTFLKVDVNVPSAYTLFTVRVLFDSKGPVYDFRKQMIFKLEANLEKTGDNWFINRLEVLEVDAHPIDWEHIVNSAGEIFD